MNTTSDPNLCSHCGASKPPQAPCPHCLLQLGFSVPAGASARVPRDRLAVPSPEELARHFPGLEIQEAIGQGGMGVVYRARHKKLDRLVALKILAPELDHDPAFAERFLREARAMARLDHVNIVAVYDFGETEGLCWLLMEYVDGVDLRAAMRSGAMTPERAMAIVPQLCDALQSAHDLGIVHRDIKPENVLLDRAGRVKVADFGLAKLGGNADEALALTQSDVGMGTLHYMAPEQLRGAHGVDHRADIFSLGVVFYEMLTGQLPIGRFDLPSGKLKLDVRLDEVVLRALESEPERRYQQATEVKTDVQAIPRASPQSDAPQTAAVAPPTGTGQAPASHAALERGVSYGRRALPIAVLIAAGLVLPSILRELPRWGTVGLVLLAISGAAWLYLLTQRVLLTRPELARALAARSKPERALRAASFAACALFGLAAFGAGTESLWELGTDQYVTPTSRVQALAEPWSEDYGYQLLRRLPQYSEEGVAVPELGMPQRDHWRRTHLPYPAGAFLLAGMALWMAGIAMCWRRERNDWAPISTPLMGTLALAGYAWFMVQMRQSGEASTLHGIGGSAVLDSDILDVRKAVAEKLIAEGHELVFEIGETLVEKRARTPITRHELLASRPQELLGRWRYERDGPRRVDPGLVIELVGVEGSGRTFVSWNAGLLRDGDRSDAPWRARLEKLWE